MAYLLVDGNNNSSTRQVTNTQPLSIKNKNHILHTVMAAEQLGFGLIYLEAGSGARNSIPASLVKTIKKHISLPVIVGGGIDSKQKMQRAISSGANMIVVGNALEKNVYLLQDISACF
jgi:geranylgeranylglyceryl phosphate synthase family protein